MPVFFVKAYHTRCDKRSDRSFVIVTVFNERDRSRVFVYEVTRNARTRKDRLVSGGEDRQYFSQSAEQRLTSPRARTVIHGEESARVDGTGNWIEIAAYRQLRLSNEPRHRILRWFFSRRPRWYRCSPFLDEPRGLIATTFVTNCNFDRNFPFVNTIIATENHRRNRTDESSLIFIRVDYKRVRSICVQWINSVTGTCLAIKYSFVFAYSMFPLRFLFFIPYYFVLITVFSRSS